MPRTLTSPEPAMSFDPARLVRGWRGLAAAIAIVAAAIGLGWGASVLVQAPPAPVQEAAAPARAGLDAATLRTLDTSGFQKRGTLLIGETTTRAGVRLRVVLDARTRELVGFRVLESE